MLTFRSASSSILPIAAFLFFAGCATVPAVPAAVPAVPAPAPVTAPVTAPARPQAVEPGGQVDIRGRVVQARRNAQGEPPVGTLQVEGALEPGTRYDKATIHVGHDTKIFLGRDGKPASFSFIHSGDLVEAIFTGPVADSQPVKATAARIVILEHVP